MTTRSNKQQAWTLNQIHAIAEAWSQWEVGGQSITDFENSDLDIYGLACKIAVLDEGHEEDLRDACVAEFNRRMVAFPEDTQQSLREELRQAQSWRDRHEDTGRPADLRREAAEAARKGSIEQIAKDVLGLETLDERKSDSLDFSEHAVWTIKKALEEAYEAGRRAR